MAQAPSDKQKRLSRLAAKLARLIHEDEQKHGALKPSYRSPKFWVYVQREMEKLEQSSEADNQ